MDFNNPMPFTFSPDIDVYPVYCRSLERTICCKRNLAIRRMYFNWGDSLLH